MTAIISRLRPLFVGLAALLLTAGIAFASDPAAPATEPTSATQTAGAIGSAQLAAPTGVEGENGGTVATTTAVATTTTTDHPTATAEEDAEAESDELSENCATDPAAPADPAAVSDPTAPTDPTATTEAVAAEDEELPELRHGSVVCWAAHQDTPEGYRNHGAWVSEWAKKNRGHESTEETTTAPTSETTTATETVVADAPADHPGKGKGKGH